MIEYNPLIHDTFRIHCDQKPQSHLCLHSTPWQRGKLDTLRRAVKRGWSISPHIHTCPFCLEALALALQQVGISNPHTTTISPPALS